MSDDEHGNGIWEDDDVRDWDITDTEAECVAEVTGGCDLGLLVALPVHYCDGADDHDGAHECACGHTWTESEGD